MNDLELQLKELILRRYGSLKNFCEIIEMPWTTLDSILKRGISKANISTLQGIGAAGAAVVSAVFGEPDIERAAAEMKQLAGGIVS